MKKIKTVDVFGIPYSVEWIDNIASEDSENDIIRGFCNFDSRQIYVAIKDTKGEKLPEEIVERTFMHEYIHGVLQEAGFGEESSREPLVCLISKIVEDGSRLLK